MKLQFVHGEGDWSGVYKDGVCIWQGHGSDMGGNLMNILSAAQALAPDVEWDESEAIDLVFQENNNRLPENLEDVHKYNEGTYVQDLGKTVRIWKDGRFVKDVGKVEYELIRGLDK